MRSVISFRDVTKTFAASGEVVSKLSLQVPQGQFLSLLGPSGCGKSTVLRLMAGLEKPDSGDIEISIGGPRVSFVFQDALLLPWRTAVENVKLPLELAEKSQSGAGSASIDERAHASLARVGLEAAAELLPHQLSGGMKMRVSLARALVTNPDVLFLDEPFSALDELTREGLQLDLHRLWQISKMTIVFVTHSMSEAAFLAERQVVFRTRGAIIASDHASSLGSERNVQTRRSLEFAADVTRLREALA